MLENKSSKDLIALFVKNGDWINTACESRIVAIDLKLLSFKVFPVWVKSQIPSAKSKLGTISTDPSKVNTSASILFSFKKAFNNLIEIDITHFGIREQSEKANFTIYPNPNNGQFTLQFSDASPAQLNSKIEIYNTLGQKMYSTTIKNQIPSTIDISNLLKGIYFVRYADKENNFSEKIVIE